MSSVYRTTLREAWQITWKKRWLWLFGLFSAFLGSGGEYNLIAKNIASVQDGGAVMTSVASVIQQSGFGVWYETFSEIVGNLNVASIALLITTLIIIIFIFVIALISQGAVVSGIFRSYKQSETGLRESWNRGRNKLKEVFWINVIGKLSLYLVFALLAIPFFYLFLKTYNLMWQWVLVVVSFLIFVPLAVVVSFLVKYAVIFAVTKNNDIGLAIRESWKLFCSNWVISIEMSLVLFAVNVIVGVGIVLGLIVTSIPFVIIGFIGVYLDISYVFWFAAILGAVVAFGGVFTVGAMLTVFQMASWVILFERLVEGVAIPKIVRLATGLPGSFNRDKK